MKMRDDEDRRNSERRNENITDNNKWEYEGQIQNLGKNSILVLINPKPSRANLEFMKKQ